MIRGRFLAFLTLLSTGLASLDNRAVGRETPAGPAAAVVPYVESGSVAGAVVLVANKSKVLSLEAVGWADVADKTPMKTDALFWIASQTKPITACGLMVLVDEGKVDLNAPLEKYLPEFKDLKFNGKPPAHSITVRQLLSHCSGMAFKSAEEAPTLDMLTLADGMKSYVKTPLTSEPGTKYLYSNMGINTAGRIIEVVSGMPYETFMEKRVFAPLGMVDTTFRPSDAQVKRLARSYKPDSAKKALEPTVITALKYPLTDPKRQPMPGGGLFSTATDVARFCMMMANGGTLDGKRVVSESAVKEMTKRQTPAEFKENYGLGWSLSPTSYGHGGAYSTNMTVDTRTGLVTVFLVQHAGFPNDGGKAQGAFRQEAERRFAPKK